MRDERPAVRSAMRCGQKKSHEPKGGRDAISEKMTDFDAPERGDAATVEALPRRVPPLSVGPRRARWSGHVHGSRVGHVTSCLAGQPAAPDAHVTGLRSSLA